ncbi:hypothetical protein [Streptomyces sp. KL116D]|uniref:hypothetical protein n=1 Tax=Streptomyces sp. KL116D TaxID=3045152 RepID=UPI003558AC5A
MVPGMLQNADYARHVFARYAQTCTGPPATSRKPCGPARSAKNGCSRRATASASSSGKRPCAP